MNEKTKVISAEIIVTGTKDKPLFEIKYKEVGKDYYNIGFGSYYLENVFEWREKYLEIVNEGENVHTENGWIPCSERLPERNKPVLCWVKSTTIESGETYIIGSCDNGFWFLQTYEIGHHHFPVKDYKVVAWQTLPEHYEEK